MSARKRTTLRITALAIFLLLALIAVGTAYAQEPGAPGGGSVPAGMDEVAARLMPLLVGAALIERTIEFLFNWVESAILDASHGLNALASRLTGVISKDLRQTWEKIDDLTEALLQREASGQPPEVGNEASPDPADWPLAKLESQIAQAQKTLNSAEQVIGTALSSKDYIARKKMAASILSIVFGVLLAIVVNLRLFEPLGVEVSNALEGGFDVIDTLLAGILMGLGTDWVHQIIGLVVKGKGLLGRAAGGESGSASPNTEEIKRLTEAMIKVELEARLSALRDEVQSQVDGLARGDAPPDLPT